MQSSVERLTLADVPILHKLGTGLGELYSRDGGENCFWPLKTLERLVVSKEDICLKLVVGGHIVGFALVMVQTATRKAVIENLYVDPEHHALSNHFYEAVETAIKVHGAEFIAHYFVTTRNSNTQEFFEKHGYLAADEVVWLHKNISFSNPVPKK